MIGEFDEPVLKNKISYEVTETDKDILSKISALLESEMYGILCTQGNEQPYGSIITFASSEDLSHIVFATPINTRKYTLLNTCSKIALVIDNRAKFYTDVNKISAVTITGITQSLTLDTEKAAYKHLLVNKHPYLKDFVKAPSTSLILVNTLRYFYVTRFQEVYQWVPKKS